MTGAGLVCAGGKLQSSPTTAGSSPVFASSSFQNYGKVLSVVGQPSDKGKQKQPPSSRPKGRVPAPGGVGRAKAKASSPPTQSQMQKKVTVGQTSRLLATGWCVCRCVRLSGSLQPRPCAQSKAESQEILRSPHLRGVDHALASSILEEVLDRWVLWAGDWGVTRRVLLLKRSVLSDVFNCSEEAHFVILSTPPSPSLLSSNFFLSPPTSPFLLQRLPLLQLLALSSNFSLSLSSNFSLSLQTSWSACRKPNVTWNDVGEWLL